MTQSWAPVFRNSHQPDKFGFLNGLKLDYLDYAYKINKLAYGHAVGENKLEFEIKNLTEGEGRRVLAKLEYTPVTGKTQSCSKPVFIPALKSSKVALNYRIAKAGPGKLCLSLEDPENHKVYLMKTMYFTGTEK